MGCTLMLLSIPQSLPGRDIAKSHIPLGDNGSLLAQNIMKPFPGKQIRVQTGEYLTLIQAKLDEFVRMFLELLLLVLESFVKQYW